MEEKNNAVEKVEGIIDEKSQTGAEMIKEELENAKKFADEAINVTKEKIKTTKSDVKKVFKKATPAERQKQKEEHEREKEQNRLERAELLFGKREASRLEREERKDAANKRASQLKLERLRKREERKKRRDILKGEDKQARHARIAREKQSRTDERIARRAHRAAENAERLSIKRESLQAKRALKQQKSRNSSQKRGSGTAGWITAVASLGCLVIVFATLFAVSLIKNFGGNEMLENSYQRNFYDFVSYVDNIDINLSKLLISNDESEQQKILSELNVQASLAANDITEIPMHDESKYYTTKFVNQVGDYAKYLNNKLIDGDSLSQTDIENLTKMQEINMQLKTELSQVAAKLGENYEFISLMDDSGNNVVLNSFITLEEGAVDYPKLIYDGPFSDALDTLEVKGLSGAEISGIEAIDIFKSIFSDYDFSKVELLGEVHGKIECFTVQGESGDVTVYTEISKVGGKLIFANSYLDCMQTSISLDETVQIASQFIKDLGIEGMKAVWATDSGATAYLNFAFEEEGVIVYPDMIKVTVCEERGVVSAYDATEYYLNHTDRKIENAKLTKQQATSKLSTKLEVETVRLAVIPKGNSKECLTYEVSGKFNGTTYYIYVDAKTGKETQIFRVVETTEGMLLI